MSLESQWPFSLMYSMLAVNTGVLCDRDTFHKNVEGDSKDKQAILSGLSMAGNTRSWESLGWTPLVVLGGLQ